jgi:nitroalkane oxidase
MIDFTLTPEQEHIKQGSATFASSILANASKDYSKLSTQRERFESLRSLYGFAVRHGQVKAQIPVALGGTNASLVDAAIAMEEMYAVDASVTLTLAAAGLGLSPLMLGGTKEQHELFLKPFLSGEGEPLASLVHSEPGGTANWLEKGGKGLQTTARKEGDFWVIDGEKVNISIPRTC